MTDEETKVEGEETPMEETPETTEEAPVETPTEEEAM